MKRKIMSDDIRKVIYNLLKKPFSITSYRAYISFVVFTALLEVGVRLHLPIIENVPTPSSVIVAFGDYIFNANYWTSWLASMYRVYGGFLVALITGIPLGLLMVSRKNAFDLIYPIFEILRPVPPLAWVPVAIIFWPTSDSSMMFLTFLGAFFPVVLNIVDGAKSIDKRYMRIAHSLGSSHKDIFWRILFPACLPSILVGMVVGMGAAWTVVIAAEMVSSTSSGLGQLTWRAYVVGEFPGIIVGMVSIGVAGYVSSGIIRSFSRFMTPWLSSKI